MSLTSYRQLVKFEFKILLAHSIICFIVNEINVNCIDKIISIIHVYNFIGVRQN